MQTLYQKTFTDNLNYFNRLFVVNQLEGRQSYIFYSMSIDAINRIGMIEVLLDEALTDEEQMVLDRGELTVPDNEQSP